MMRLSEIADFLAGRLAGGDAEFEGVSTDSRSIAAGELFVALKGDNFDGNLFAAEVYEKGAAAALLQAGDYAYPDKPMVLVADTRIALGKLAALWRSRNPIKLAAVTGSNGKTTVKEMLSSILEQESRGKVLSTVGNLNNDIGLPLTLLKLRAHHRFAVVEMGMNHPGEIEYLSNIARPDVALVNNAAAAHLAGLGSLAAVARAKGEIFSGLAETGTAIWNADDEFAPLWRELAGNRRTLTFGLEKKAHVSARYLSSDFSSELEITLPSGRVQTKISVPGRHNVMNALAAAAAAHALGAGKIAEGLAAFSGVKGRMQKKAGFNDALVIDDTYNANPASAAAASEWLGKLQGETILVLGDMGELGEKSEELHREIGKKAKGAGVKKLYALGKLASRAAESFGEGSQSFTSAEELVASLTPLLTAKTTVLVKGSRFMKMERVVNQIIAGDKACC